MSNNNLEIPITFFADKVYVHHWPLSSPKWDEAMNKIIDLKLNKNSEKKKVKVGTLQIHVDDVEFTKIKKFGVTIPLFKKETTMVFEGKFQNFDAHIHITTQSENYLAIFNKLMNWKNSLQK